MHAMKWLALLLVFVVSSSNADEPNVMFCPDDGCTVITCSSQWCEVWYCEGGECIHIGHYPNLHGGDSGGATIQGGSAPDLGQKGAVEPLSGPKRGGLNCGQQRCVIKTCSDLQCSVVGFDSGSSSILGSFENTDSLVDEIAKDFIEPDHNLSSER